MAKNIKIDAYLFTVMGLAFLLGALYSSFNTVSFLRNSISVKGTVIELVRSESKYRSRERSEPEIFFSPVVQFISQNGVNIEFISPVGSNPPLFSVGQEVEVLYHLQNPQNAKINERSSLWFLSLCLSILGSSFFLLGSGMIIVSRVKRRRTQYLMQHGVVIETDCLWVQAIKFIRINDKHPFLIFTRWRNPETLKTHFFMSDFVWLNPSNYMTKKIKVFIEINNPKKYSFDLSFLPTE